MATSAGVARSFATADTRSPADARHPACLRARGEAAISALLAAGTVATAALKVLPESFARPFAAPTGVALIGLGISIWRTQRTSVPADAPLAPASAVTVPAGAEH